MVRSAYSRGVIGRGVAVVLLVLGMLIGVARAEDPVLPGQPNDAAAQAYERGERLLAKGQYEEAAAAFDEAAKRAPLFHLAHYAAGNALARSGKLREAEKRYRRAVEVAPTFARGWNALGVVLMAGDRTEAALTAFERAVKADGKFTLARLHRGQALLRLGRLDDAETALRDVLRRDKKSVAARVALATARAGLGDLDEAGEIVAAALAAEPTNGNALLLRATLAFRGGDLDDAAAGLADVLAKAGDQRAVREGAARLANKVAEAARTRGELNAHVSALETLVALAPKNPRAHALIGAALLTRFESQAAETRTGRDRDRAVRALERSLELDPKNEAVRKLLERYRDP